MSWGQAITCSPYTLCTQKFFVRNYGQIKLIFFVFFFIISVGVPFQLQPQNKLYGKKKEENFRSISYNLRVYGAEFSVWKIHLIFLNIPLVFEKIFFPGVCLRERVWLPRQWWCFLFPIFHTYIFTSPWCRLNHRFFLCGILCTETIACKRYIKYLRIM